MADVPEVLFVCTHNAGRSQMAAALLNEQAAGRVRVTSAGSQPASQLNPAVVQAMAEIGLDISAGFPKPLTTGNVQAAGIVITMGCGDACPVYPGKRYLDWDLPDPAGLTVEQIRPIRDEISARVRALLSDLDAWPIHQHRAAGQPSDGLDALPAGPGLQLVELGVQAAGPGQRGVIPAGRDPAPVQDRPRSGPGWAAPRPRSRTRPQRMTAAC